jgi:hypothetical protein
MPLDSDTVRAMMLASGEPDRALQAAVDAGEDVWDTTHLTTEFDVEGFAAPFVVVRKKDGTRGTLMFTHNPRLYFGFIPTS